MRKNAVNICITICFIVCLLTAPPLAIAQTRMSDSDIESTMKNLKEDSKQFQSLFNSAISKSTIRKTSQEKDAKALVQNFRNQTEVMLKTFLDQKKADATLPVVLDSAQRIDKQLADVPLNGNVTRQWAKVKAELSTLSDQFNIRGPSH